MRGFRRSEGFTRAYRLRGLIYEGAKQQSRKRAWRGDRNTASNFTRNIFSLHLEEAFIGGAYARIYVSCLQVDGFKTGGG